MPICSQFRLYICFQEISFLTNCTYINRKFRYKTERCKATDSFSCQSTSVESRPHCSSGLLSLIRWQQVLQISKHWSTTLWQTQVNTKLHFFTRYVFSKFQTQTVNKPLIYNNILRLDDYHTFLLILPDYLRKR